ncbi:hypothetical protein [Amycolatopsis jejuensis]|uniref:hypothetical protein n=1 Tax=Amycolatopsis jejuensis TaxID=330084 RepID=UPI0012E02ED0|nr:hypothetical protein [Amycolatopsis jejuensis]
MSPAVRMHEVLLGVAGLIPDEALESARLQLAGGGFGVVADIVTRELAACSRSMTVAQAGVLSEWLDDSAAEVFTSIPITDEVPALPWVFAEAGDDADEAQTAVLVQVLERTPAARGLWLAHRRPLRREAAPLPVYVITTDGSADLAALTGRLHAAIRSGGAGIEVVGPGEVPVYQRVARGYGVLAWAAAEQPELRVATVFEHADGSAVGSGHVRISDPVELGRTLEYLRAGFLLLATDATLPDVVAPERGEVVPASYRTDGTWLWPDAVAYYLAEHGLAPCAPFLAHIRAVAGPPRQPDAVAVHRALQHLLDPGALNPRGPADPVSVNR